MRPTEKSEHDFSSSRGERAAGRKRKEGNDVPRREERRLEIPGLPAAAGGPALKFDIDHLANPGAVTRSGFPRRSFAGTVREARRVRRKPFRSRLTISRQQTNSARIDRSIDRSLRSLARSLAGRTRAGTVYTANTARALYTRYERDTRTLATIAGSALARGGARTFSSWRYRAASRRLPASRLSLFLSLYFSFSPPPHPSARERQRPLGGATPGAPLNIPMPPVDGACDRYPRRTYCQSKEREITSANKGCQSALSVL